MPMSFDFNLSLEEMVALRGVLQLGRGGVSTGVLVVSKTH